MRHFFLGSWLAIVVGCASTPEPPQTTKTVQHCRKLYRRMNDEGRMEWVCVREPIEVPAR